MIEHNTNFQGGAKKKNMLPEVNKKVSLRKHGYRLNQSKISRRKSLRKASRTYGTLPVLRRVNLIRNYSKKNKDKYKTLSNDVEFMKDKYAYEKKTNTVKKPIRKTRNTKTTRKQKRSKITSKC